MATQPIPIPSTRGGGQTIDNQALALQVRIQQRLDNQVLVGSPGSAQANYDYERQRLTRAANMLNSALSPFAHHSSGELVAAIRYAESVLD
ncbi:MAG TPA: hypothetical protein VIM60_09940 [Edaphobacter sp.]